MEATPSPRTDVRDFETIPGIGPAAAGDLREIGLRRPTDLVGRDPFALFEELIRVTGSNHDPCVIDQFIGAVRYMEGEPARPWWHYTAERKRVLGARQRD